MGQSKLPAKCSVCNKVGPSRKVASKQGWKRETGRWGRPPVWYCPDHAPVENVSESQPERLSTSDLSLVYALMPFMLRNRLQK